MEEQKSAPKQITMYFLCKKTLSFSVKRGLIKLNISFFECECLIWFFNQINLVLVVNKT